MKKICTLAITVLAAQLPALAAQLPTANSAQVRTANSEISVFGLKWGSSPDQVKNWLSPRFEIAPQFSSDVGQCFSGELNGTKVVLSASYTPKSHKLARVSISQQFAAVALMNPDPASVFALASIAMENWSRILARKYGRPAVHVRTANSSKDVIAGLGELKDVWRLRDGTISCYVSVPGGIPFPSVDINYEQDKMQKIDRMEYGQLTNEQDEAAGKDL